MKKNQSQILQGFFKFFLFDRTNSPAVILSSAVMLSLAMPGRVGLWPLLFVAVVPLMRFSLYATPKKSAITGFLTGLLFYSALLYWIVIVLGRYGGLPLYVTIPAMLLLAAYMSLYIAAFMGLLSMLAGRSWHKERPLVSMVVLAPALWVGLDWFRGIFGTGFPWMDLAYGLYKQPLFIQAADLGGHYLITFCLILINALLVYLFEIQKNQVRWNVMAEKRIILFLSCFLMFIGGYSFLQYQEFTRSKGKTLDAQVTVVQGNIAQDEKWTPEKKQETVDRYINLSKKILDNNQSELVVWPETALPFFPQREPLFQEIVDFAITENVWLLTGTPFYTRRTLKPEEKGAKEIDYFNSAILINAKGELAGRYDKQHLVPFGEYVPMRRALPFLEPLVQAVGDFTVGRSAEPLMFGGLKVGVLICFESIFPDLARKQVENKANLLVNITNDAWYGHSSAPHQTLAMAVFRAVENRRSLVRAANTGISCSVDPAGDIVVQTKIFSEDSFLANIPVLEKNTLYTRIGHYFGACCFSFVLAFLIFKRK